MAQSVTCVFEMDDSTELLNKHVSKIIAKGPYHGLMVKATTPNSMFIDITAGYAFTIEGVKIEEGSDLSNVVEVSAADATYDRKDLIVMRHKYVAGPTIPPGNFATYRVVTGDLPPDSLTPPEPPYDQLDEYDIPLAEVWVNHGATYITDSMIYNLRRTMTTLELQDELAKALYIALGNFAFRGWKAFDAGSLVLGVTEGEGLLCGKYHVTDADSYVHTLRARSYLRPPNDPNTGDPYEVGDNLTLLEQPDYPTFLRITITTTNEATSGNIYISGKGMDPSAPDIINHAVPVNQGPNEAVVYETSVVFSEVFLEGIDAQELVRSGSHIYINITDRPRHYIYAVGTPTGVPYFRAELNPAYQPLCNEMLIALVETDETHIIDITDYTHGALVPITEQVFPPCDGVTRVFYLSQEPKPGTLDVTIDGNNLYENTPFGKGYTLDGKKITLEANVPTPDGNTLLMAKYLTFS